MRLDLSKLSWVVRLAQDHRETSCSDEAADLAVEHVNRWLAFRERQVAKRRRAAKKKPCPNCHKHHGRYGCVDA